VNTLSELHYEEAVRSEVLKFLTEDPDYGLRNLSMTNLGLAQAVLIMSEMVKMRVDLGDFEATAIAAVIEGLRIFLEECELDNPASFALFMTKVVMPLIELPNGQVIRNMNACELWRDDSLPMEGD
jgi:hypothetical protein